MDGSSFFFPIVFLCFLCSFMFFVPRLSEIFAKDCAEGSGAELGFWFLSLLFIGIGNDFQVPG